jgi:predicted Zn-dependent peptidase
VESFTRQALADFLRRFYTSDAMILAAAGAVDHDEVVRLAEQHFTHRGRANGHVPVPASYGGGAVEHEDDVEQMHLVVGFDGVGYADDDYYAAQLLTSALGGGMSSRLFQEVREKRGLAYSIYAFHSSMVDGGLFGVYAGCADEDAAEVATLVSDELMRATDGISPAELERARTQMKAGLLMARESTSSRCEAVARQMLIYGRPQTQEELVARLDAVGTEDIRRSAERLFRGSKPTVATIGPRANLAQYDRIAGRMS